MKKVISILSGFAMLLSACSTHRNMTFNNSLLIGTWEQPNVTLDFKANGHYDYLYFIRRTVTATSNPADISLTRIR